MKMSAQYLSFIILDFLANLLLWKYQPIKLFCNLQKVFYINFIAGAITFKCGRLKPKRIFLI